MVARVGVSFRLILPFFRDLAIRQSGTPLTVNFGLGRISRGVDLQDANSVRPKPAGRAIV